MQRVAVLGLGIIGGGIAKNLLGRGFPVTVYNRSRDKAAPFEAAGATGAATPAEAVRDADVVICAVADDRASEAVWLGQDGALAAARPDATLVECSTLSTEWVGRLADAARRRGVKFLDAPVLGSKDAAEGGQLRLLVGGAEADLDHVREVLDAFSAESSYLGPNGAGARMKLINNAIVAVQIVALAEGLVLAERAGLDVDQAGQLLANGAAGSPAVKGRAARMVSHDYEDVHFALRWMRKDAGYALALGQRHGIPLATVVAVGDTLQAAMDLGYGELDFAAVIEALRAQGIADRG